MRVVSLFAIELRFFFFFQFPCEKKFIYIFMYSTKMSICFCNNLLFYSSKFLSYCIGVKNTRIFIFKYFFFFLMDLSFSYHSNLEITTHNRWHRYVRILESTLSVSKNAIESAFCMSLRATQTNAVWICTTGKTWCVGGDIEHIYPFPSINKFLDENSMKIRMVHNI